MKFLFIIPLVLMSLVSSPSWGLSMDDLVHREGLTTRNLRMFRSLVKLMKDLIRTQIQGRFPDGHWILYYEDGELLEKGDFKNGRMEGEWVFFDKDGTKQMSELKIGETVLNEGSGVYRDGEKVSD